MKCFGLNYHGILGTCWAVDNDGNVGSCFELRYRNWTRGYGLGTGQMGDALPIVDLGTGVRVRQITTGTFFSCALLNTGSIKCFGDNSQGQLGLGDTIARGDLPNQMGDNLPPINLGVAVPVRSIASGNEHSCAVFEDESVKCWGNNPYNQLNY